MTVAADGIEGPGGLCGSREYRAFVREFGFELRMCAQLESMGELVARQLGGGVHRPGTRILDVVRLEPGPEFSDRADISASTIPAIAIEADVGVGRFRYWKDTVRGLDVSPERCREMLDRAVEIGFLERERRRGRDVVRQTARYPGEWFGRIRAIENKPDLGRPGDLLTQVRHDVALALVDEIVVATRSHVTGAHLNRLPEEAGVWKVGDGGIEVIREPSRLPVDEAGVELLEERPGRSVIRIATSREKAVARRNLAERAYGKGWRTYSLPPCVNVESHGLNGVPGLPRCSWRDRLVDPAAECGGGCPGFVRADPPAVDPERQRARRSPWVRDPPGGRSRQSELARFEPGE